MRISFRFQSRELGADVINLTALGKLFDSVIYFMSEGTPAFKSVSRERRARSMTSFSDPVVYPGIDEKLIERKKHKFSSSS